MLLSSHYFPSLEYFVCLLNEDSITIEIHDFFERHSYRNRCCILTTNKIDTLSVPVLKQKNKIQTKDIKIDYQQDWQRRHWGAIVAGYGKAPFFTYYESYFKAILDKKPVFLLDLNLQVLETSLFLLKIKKDISLSVAYQENIPKDYRKIISPKINFSLNTIYREYPYHQNFGDTFIPNLSILDLLFCEGTQAISVLKNSIYSS